MDDQVGSFYEFFAGAGMARAGLGERWNCLFANDNDRKKAATYALNWGTDVLKCVDVRAVTTTELPGIADLVWASFPCQDLSLAGVGAGLEGKRSSTFWPFCDLMATLGDEGRAPRMIVLENVCGAVTSHDGRDFKAICSALRAAGYRVGALVVDAALFVPQLRRRLFVVAVKEGIIIPEALFCDGPTGAFYPRALRNAFQALPDDLREDWIWWRLSAPASSAVPFSDLLEEDPRDVAWHTPAETRKLLEMMSETNLNKVRSAKLKGTLIVGTGYKRMRRDANGRKIQRAEVRFDDLAVCLRTPAGGSSRQLIVVVQGRKVRSRLISSRETARLMGLPDGYKLPNNYNEAYHLTGDGVVVPVVRFLAAALIEPVLSSTGRLRSAA